MFFHLVLLIFPNLPEKTHVSSSLLEGKNENYAELLLKMLNYSLFYYNDKLPIRQQNQKKFIVEIGICKF